MEIFQLKIRETGPAQYRVFAEDAENLAPVINFVPDPKLTLKLERLSERGPNGIQTFVEHEATCKEIGEEIFSSFVQGRTLQQFRAYTQNSSRPRLAIHIPQSLYYLPWEVIRDPTDPPGQFLSLKGSVTRFDIDSAQNADNV